MSIISSSWCPPISSLSDLDRSTSATVVSSPATMLSHLTLGSSSSSSSTSSSSGPFLSSSMPSSTTSSTTPSPSHVHADSHAHKLEVAVSTKSGSASPVPHHPDQDYHHHQPRHQPRHHHHKHHSHPHCTTGAASRMVSGSSSSSSSSSAAFSSSTHANHSNSNASSTTYSNANGAAHTPNSPSSHSSRSSPPPSSSLSSSHMPDTNVCSVALQQQSLDRSSTRDDSLMKDEPESMALDALTSLAMIHDERVALSRGASVVETSPLLSSSSSSSSSTSSCTFTRTNVSPSMERTLPSTTSSIPHYVTGSLDLHTLAVPTVSTYGPGTTAPTVAAAVGATAAAAASSAPPVATAGSYLLPSDMLGMLSSVASSLHQHNIGALDAAMRGTTTSASDWSSQSAAPSRWCGAVPDIAPTSTIATTFSNHHHHHNNKGTDDGLADGLAHMHLKRQSPVDANGLFSAHAPHHMLHPDSSLHATTLSALLHPFAPFAWNHLLAQHNVTVPSTRTPTMHCVRQIGFGDPSRALAWTSTMPIPLPGSGQVLIRVHAASVNPIDVKIIRGDTRSFMRRDLPCTPGFDLSGVITAVGPNVTRLHVGDMVFADSTMSNGAFADFAVLDESLVSLMPRNVSFAQAACVPLAGLTSLCAMEKANLQCGESILILGGSGGTGSFAIQLAALIGARYIAVTCSGKNAAYCKSLGAHEVFDYTQLQPKEQQQEQKEHPTRTLLDQVRGQRFDIVFDCVGDVATARLLPQLLREKTGRYLTLVGEIDNDVMVSRLPVTSCWILGRALSSPAPGQQAFLINGVHANSHTLDYLAALIEGGHITIASLVERVYPWTFEGVLRMLAHSESGRTRGKVVMQMQQVCM